jgi:hypothetical protein
MVYFVTPCSVTLDYHSFGGKCFHHFQSQIEWRKCVLGFRKSYYCYYVRLCPQILCVLLPLGQTEISHGTLPWIIHFISICNRIDTEDGSNVCLLNVCIHG